MLVVCHKCFGITEGKTKGKKYCNKCLDEKEKAYNKRWRDNNRERFIKGVRKWQEENPERKAENERRYRKKKRKEYNKYIREYRKKNLKKVREINNKSYHKRKLENLDEVIEK